MKNPVEKTPARWESLPSWLLTQTASHAHRLVAEGFSSVNARGYHYRLLATLEQFGPASQAALGRRSGIHLSDIPALNYADELFQERQLRSVTANTRADGEAFLDLAARIPLKPTTVPYPLAEADRALGDLAGDRITGAAVLEVGGLGDPVATAPVLSFSEQLRPELGLDL